LDRLVGKVVLLDDEEPTGFGALGASPSRGPDPVAGVGSDRCREPEALKWAEGFMRTKGARCSITSGPRR
jgi:hypothetical protein